MSDDLMELREATLQLLAALFTRRPFCEPLAPAAAALAARAGGGGDGGGGGEWVASRVTIAADGRVPGVGERAAGAWGGLTPRSLAAHAPARPLLC
jgi:hypothetical protein